MNLAALYHRPQSEYAFPTSLDRCTLRLRAARGDVKCAAAAIHTKYDEKLIERVPMKKSFSDGLFDWFECSVALDRGRRVYHFELEGEDGTRLLYTDNGPQKPDEESGAYFPHFQIPFLSESDVHTVPDKFRGTAIYQIFPDRFYTESPKCDWAKQPAYNDFFGGELWGAAQKLGYIKELGFNAVYLTPVHPSHTNHHYDVEDYYRVADELGGDDALRAFIKRAHELKIKVILDGVFNHCSCLNPMFKSVCELGAASPYYKWFLIDGDKPDFKRCNYRTFANKVAYMPKLNCDEPEVADFVADVATYWIREFGIDAWRLDVADDVAPALWRKVRAAVKRADPSAVMIGEDWMDAHAFLRGDVFDGVMNYGFTRVVRDYLAYGRTDAAGAASGLVRNLMRYTAPASAMMMDIIGSHDTHRFYSLCGEDAFKHKAALAIMFFFEGMPTVYYGDELPMNGLHDPDCRRGFDWSRTGSPTAELVRLLAGLRTSDPMSVQSEITSEGGALIMRRRGAREISLIVNASNEKAVTRGGAVPPRTIVIDADGRTVVTDEN